MALRQAGRPEEALQALQEALARSPDQAELNLNVATIYRRQERGSQAARHYEVALRGMPRETGALFGFGYLRSPDGLLVELVDVATRPMLEQGLASR